jgi:hypothetical protein
MYAGQSEEVPMRSAILVDAVLNYEIRGDLIHVTDEGGEIHMAATRNIFLANLARAKVIAVEAMSTGGASVRRIGGQRH